MLADEHKSYRLEQAFLKKVLAPYPDHCQYLKSLLFSHQAPPAPASERDRQQAALKWPQAKGDFAIAESCYIDDTGHFNAVELNICFNQFFYSFIATCIKERLLKELHHFSLDDFFKYQLSNILIVRLCSSFRKAINARQFCGTLAIQSIRKNKRFVLLKTACTFFDQHQGFAEAEVSLTILDQTSVEGRAHGH